MITSLHSPHIAEVKALLGARGVKERRERGAFVVEGLQNIRELLRIAPQDVRQIFLTEEGRQRLSTTDLSSFDVIEVSDQVMAAMTDTVTPQGVLAVSAIRTRSFEEWLHDNKSKNPLRIAFFWQIQDPGNAGTVIRTADAFGFDAIVFSDNSVDAFAPKVVRSTAGSLWHVELFQEITFDSLMKCAEQCDTPIFATDTDGELSILDMTTAQRSRVIWVFGNEARGIPEEWKVKRVSIPMSGGAESLNLASAAAVVMFTSSN